LLPSSPSLPLLLHVPPPPPAAAAAVSPCAAPATTMRGSKCSSRGWDCLPPGALDHWDSSCRRSGAAAVQACSNQRWKSCTGEPVPAAQAAAGKGRQASGIEQATRSVTGGATSSTKVARRAFVTATPNFVCTCNQTALTTFFVLYITQPPLPVQAPHQSSPELHMCRCVPNYHGNAAHCGTTSLYPTCPAASLVPSPPPL
jgi:hypothetical protein